MKLFKKLLAFSSIGLIPMVAVACGRDVKTDEKIRQDKLFAGKNVKDVVESLWLGNTLKSLYNISETKNIDNEKFKADAYQVYKTFLKNQFQKDTKYLQKEIISLLSKGLISNTQYNSLQSLISSYYPNITMEQFLILYNIKESKVQLTVEKNLLVNKYLTISTKEDLEKVYASTYSKRKDDYDLNNFILINYLIDKKLTQTWSFSSSSENDVFTSSVKTINKIDDYASLSLKTFDAAKVANDDVLFSSLPFERKIGGFKGLESSSLNFDYSLDVLKNNNSKTLTNGFYDYSKKTLIKVNEDETLAEPLPITSQSNSILVTYVNRLLPLAKDYTIQNPDESKRREIPTVNIKKLTLEGTPLINDLIKLTTSLYNYDSNLYEEAVSAFVKLGNKIKLEVEDQNLKKAIQGLKYAE